MTIEPTDEAVASGGDRIRLGLHALGIGPGSRRAVIDAVASAAERCRFATLWSGEHVVMVDQPRSRYPYADDGRIAVSAVADWIDPMIGLSFAAAATSTIRLATGVMLLPEHNPIIVAKQVATLDRLSGGRFTLGVGIGWSREEFDALGVPFAARAERTASYVAAMRTIWRSDVATYHSEFASFENIRVNPKPLRSIVPIMLGGNSDSALRRTARWGDGWYGFNLDGVDAVRERLDRLDHFCLEADRNRADLDVAVALRAPDPADVPRLGALGVDELVLVDTPPDDASQAAEWVENVAARWISTPVTQKFSS